MRPRAVPFEERMFRRPPGLLTFVLGMSLGMGAPADALAEGSPRHQDGGAYCGSDGTAARSQAGDSAYPFCGDAASATAPLAQRALEAAGAASTPSGTRSVLEFIPSRLHTAIRRRTNTEDLSQYLQRAFDSYAHDGDPVGRLWLPSGEYRIERTLHLKGHQILFGELGDRNLPGNPGTELVWYGPDGGTAVITAPSDDEDWSRSGIEGVTIRNATARATGWGLKVRNPQNGSYLRHVFVLGFPSRQVLVYEPRERRRMAGTTPGYWFAEDLYAVGGEVPVEIEVGVEPGEIRHLGVGTDARSRVGVLLHRSPIGQPQRAPLVISSSFVEMSAGSGDISGFEWRDDLAVTFIGCAVQRNGRVPVSTRAAFNYTGRQRSLPTAEIINCTSWQLRNLYAFEVATLSVAAVDPGVPESFSWSRNAADAMLVFSRGDLASATAPVALYADGGPGPEDGLIMHRAGTVVGVAAVARGTPTAGRVTINVLRNGTTVARRLELSDATPSRIDDYTVGTTINSELFHFRAGDRLGVVASTTHAGAGKGVALRVQVIVRFR